MSLTPLYVKAQIRFIAQKLSAQGLDPTISRDYYLEQQQIIKRNKAREQFVLICEHHFKICEADYDA